MSEVGHFLIKIQKNELTKWKDFYKRILRVGIFNIVLWEFRRTLNI